MITNLAPIYFSLTNYLTGYWLHYEIQNQYLITKSNTDLTTDYTFSYHILIWLPNTNLVSDYWSKNQLIDDQKELPLTKSNAN